MNDPNRFKPIISGLQSVLSKAARKLKLNKVSNKYIPKHKPPDLELTGHIERRNARSKVTSKVNTYRQPYHDRNKYNPNTCNHLPKHLRKERKS